MNSNGIGIGWRHPHYAALLQERPALDFIEVHSENFFADGGATMALLHEARSTYPVSLHGVGLGLGSAAGVDDWHLERLARLVASIDPVRISDHASFARAPLHTGRMAHAADLLPIPFNAESLDMLCANVHRVQERLQRPIAVENLSAYIHWNNSDMAEPQFLMALARRTGCGLLVDVNNLYVNALNLLGPTPTVSDAAVARAQTAVASCRDWLDAIAPDVVAELHLAGHVDCGDIVIDDHGSRVCPEVWALHRHALARFGAVPTLIEWDTDVPPLQTLLDEAARARHSLDTEAKA